MTTPPDRVRRDFERRHRRWLRPGAVTEADAGPRAHPEPEAPYRTCFQRDRDRVMHCAAFRRLDFKTQVFVPHEHDHFRTRLTHTLEVAQVARDLGRALRLNEDLIEAVALAHDLGHPPFGHTGEEVLAELLSGTGGFEHNRQSLRVVDYLEHPYPQFRGLNLTHAVRECLARHETRYDTPAAADFPPGLRGPLEGQLVDLADEIAYTSADLEDALASGLLGEQDLAGLALWRRAAEAARAQAPDARPIHQRIRAVKAVLSLAAEDLLATTRARLDEAGVRTVDDVRRSGRRLVGPSDERRAELDELQLFLLERVYRHPSCLRRAKTARRIVTGLFEAFTTRGDLLPQRYARRGPAEGIERVVCDYIAGMTDRFARQEYQRAVGPLPD